MCVCIYIMAKVSYFEVKLETLGGFEGGNGQINGNPS